MAKRRRISKAVLAENVAGYIAISPWLIGFLIFSLGPIIAAIYLSLTRYTVLKPPDFRGLANYTRMFTRDPLFYKTLTVTATYTIGAVSGGLILGVALAMLLNQKIKGQSIYRTVYYLPAVVPGIAAAYMWRRVWAGQGGVVNAVLALFGIEGQNWLFDLQLTLPTMIVMSYWGVGAGMVLYLSALQGVPTALYESASIDGAGRFRKFFSITLPMISPVIFFNFVMGIIGSFQVFTVGYAITRGGPGNATLFYVLNLYRHAFENFKMGYASALGIVLFIIIMILTIIAFAVSGRFVYYEGQLR